MDTLNMLVPPLWPNLCLSPRCLMNLIVFGLSKRDLTFFCNVANSYEAKETCIGSDEISIASRLLGLQPRDARLQGTEQKAILPSQWWTVRRIEGKVVSKK